MVQKEDRVNSLANVNANEVSLELQRRNDKANYCVGLNKTKEASEFLHAVNLMAKNLPHSNEAAKYGRKDALSMEIAFGFPQVFFAVSPADDSSCMLTVCAGFEEKMKGAGTTVKSFWQMSAIGRQRI